MNKGLISHSKRDGLGLLSMLLAAICGALVGMFIAGLCYEIRESREYQAVTKQHLEMYRAEKCRGCHE